MNAQLNQAAESFRPYAIALMRVVLGIVFVYHAWWKITNFALAMELFGKWGIPLPFASAALSTGVEMIGGVALILGIGVAYAALPLAAVMLVAILTVHLPAGFALPNGYEFALTVLAATIAQGSVGAGAFSLESALRQKSLPAAGRTLETA